MVSDCLQGEKRKGKRERGGRDIVTTSTKRNPICIRKDDGGLQEADVWPVWPSTSAA